MKSIRRICADSFVGTFACLLLFGVVASAGRGSAGKIRRVQIGLRARQHISHLHIANPVGRVVPLNRSQYDYGPFFENLKRVGYEGRISVEAGGQELSQTAAQSITFLRSAFSQ